MSNPNQPSASPSALAETLALQRLEHLRLQVGIGNVGVRLDEHAAFELARTTLVALDGMARVLLQEDSCGVPGWGEFAASLVENWLLVKQEVLNALPPATRLRVLGAAANADVTEAEVSTYDDASPAAGSPAADPVLAAASGAGKPGGLELARMLERMTAALANSIGPVVPDVLDERVAKQEAKALPLSQSVDAWLERLPVRWLRSIAWSHGVPPRQKKVALVGAIATCLLSPARLRVVLAESLDDDARIFLGELVALGDIKGEEYDAAFAGAAVVPWDWVLVEPAVLPPGRLRTLGLGFVGCRNGSPRFAMPTELHAPVAQALLPLLEDADVPVDPNLLEGLGVFARGRTHELVDMFDTPDVGPAILPARGPASILELEVSLDVERRVRRRLLVSSHRSLGSLHEIVQIAFGWENYHLHEFFSADTEERYGSPDGQLGCQSEWGTTVGEVLPSAGAGLAYTYDFGDDWQHDIRCIALHPPGSTPSEPHCLAGEGACPPEDVGGGYGYREYLRALADPKHPEHKMMVEWRGPDFDPALFDLNAVNARLAPLAQKPAAQ